MLDAKEEDQTRAELVEPRRVAATLGLLLLCGAYGLYVYR